MSEAVSWTIRSGETASFFMNQPNDFVMYLHLCVFYHAE